MTLDWRTGEHQRWLEIGGGYKVGPIRSISVEETPEMREAMQRKEEPAKRFDAGKPRVDLIPAQFIEALGEHMRFGAEKYGEHNWLKGMSYSRILGSLERHTQAWKRGEQFDEDGRPHAIAAAWNAMAMFIYEEYGIGTDDRIKLEKKNEKQNING